LELKVTLLNDRMTDHLLRCSDGQLWHLLITIPEDTACDCMSPEVTTDVDRTSRTTPIGDVTDALLKPWADCDGIKWHRMYVRLYVVSVAVVIQVMH